MRNNLNLRHMLICIGLIALVAAGCGDKGKKTMVDRLLSEAKQKFAPDRRTAVFDIAATIEGDGIMLKGVVHNREMKDQIIRFFRENGQMNVLDSLQALPEPGVLPKEFGVVGVSVANLRSGHEHQAEMVTQALLGTPLRILRKHRGWFYVQTPEGYLGWTDDEIPMMTSDEYDQWSRLPKVTVTEVFGFTHESPDPGSPVVSDVVVGAILALDRESGKWYEVHYPDGRTGYLPKDAAEKFAHWLANAKDTPETIVATAKRFTGIPYLWGGTSSKGLDCSGFTKTVYYLNGTLLPRDADQQSAIGETVDTTADCAHVQPGDLLFFGPRSDRVTHVGISLGGKRFIHESGYVRINSLDPDAPDYSGFRRNMFLRAQRIIGADERQGVIRLSHIPYYNSEH